MFRVIQTQNEKSFVRFFYFWQEHTTIFETTLVAHQEIIDKELTKKSKVLNM